jgi:cysteine desulfurase/selenocysteine lyase
MSHDVDAIRAQFPILQRSVHGHPLAYLDSAASAQKPLPVIEAMDGAMRGSYANVHRGLHALANETTESFERARAGVARFLNAPDPDTIVFTKGATEAINLVASGLAAEIAPGDEIILSAMEHHANIVPWHFLRERQGAALRWLEIDDDGGIDLEAFAAMLTPRTKMVALTHMSNVLGARTPAGEIVRIAHEAGVRVLLDGCQAIVHEPVDVAGLGVDFYVFSGHKLYGPTGIGVLYGRADRLAALRPYQGGGEMIDQVFRDRITYNAAPHRFEAGTPPILEAIGLHAAIEWLEGLDRAAIAAHEQALRTHLESRLAELNWVRIFGRAPDKGAITAFAVEGAHPHDVAQVLDRYGLAIRAGHHCAQPLMQRLGVSATARASFGLYNTLHEADRLVEGLLKARQLLS